ncbi:protease synthase and sporulation protein [Sulfobacillus acidophilus TPY]|nr:protease synthase and sporulation protein [Sulfobacillus acidophilus TPY]
MLVFQGPHAYISSSWYAVEEVPTWDYLAVHAYGTVRVLTSEELKTVLETMLIRYESHRENGRLWSTFNPALHEREMRAIVGFEIEVTEIQAAAKMSQNRTDEDYRAIVTALEESNDAEARRVAEWMRNRRPRFF